MLQGVPPTKMLSNNSFASTCLLVAFVENHAALYDTVIAKSVGRDLTTTLMYKLLTICGNTYSANRAGKTLAWIEETRSTQL